MQPPPPEAEYIHYSYYSGTSYDEAWPWDEITDPATRAAVYDRYLPWNTP